MTEAAKGMASTKSKPRRGWRKKRTPDMPGAAPVASPAPPTHDFQAENGWSASMTRHGWGRGICWEARIHDPKGTEIRRMWISTNLRDAKATVEERIRELADERVGTNQTGEARV